MTNDLNMFTQQEVAELLNTTVRNVSMLRQLDILHPIKTGRNYMYSREDIKNFQHEYAGQDVSNLDMAKRSKIIIMNKGF